jgi:hypothetical protein
VSSGENVDTYVELMVPALHKAGKMVVTFMGKHLATTAFGIQLVFSLSQPHSFTKDNSQLIPVLPVNPLSYLLS